MKRQKIHPEEMELRSDEDHLAMLHMIGEGAPDFSRRIEHHPAPPPFQGFSEHDLPRAYQ